MAWDLPIGIVIPARNAAPWLGTALRSVLAQTIADWRVVVVDDGSTDATASVAAGFADVRIRLIRQPPAGVSAARNRGIATLAGSAALLFLDADDWLAPDALARLAAELHAAPAAVAACGPYAPVTAAGLRLGIRPAVGGDLLVRLLTRNRFVNGGHLLVRAAAVRQAGGFRPELSYGEDWDCWVRLAAIGQFVAIPGRAPVLFVRRRADGACLRAATDPAAFAPALEAAFGNPVLATRFAPGRLARLRRRMTAEADWVTGRALLW
ncbi:MAG: glycosyltransferase family 2 protein, partial [Acetobacteraceae bacterium]